MRALALVLGLAAFAAAMPAHAQPRQVSRVVVLRFTGWHADEARQMLVEQIAPYVELVDEERAVFAAQELGVDVSTPEGMQQVVEHLGITLVIAGAVEGRARRAETVVVVVNSRGDELATERGPAPVEANRVALGGAAVRAIEAAQAALAAPDAPPADTPEGDPQTDPVEGTDPIVEDPVEEDLDLDVEPVAWRQPYVIALAGLRIRSVSTRINNESGGPPFAFAADPYPEIDLVGVFRPLAGANDASRGLLLGLEASFSVGIAYLAVDGNPYGMTTFHVRADVGYGYVLGDIFELSGMIGFGVDGVALDQPIGGGGFPSATYSYLRPAVMGRVRAYEDLFLVELGLGGRIGLDGGGLAGAFGPGLVFGGVDLFAGFAGIIAPGFSWAARFGYTFHVLSFDGAGGPSGDGLDGADEVFEARFLVGIAL